MTFISSNLKEKVENFLMIVEATKIRNLSDIESRIGERYPLSPSFGSSDEVIFGKEESSNMESFLFIDYCAYGSKEPIIRAKFSSRLRYTRVSIRSQQSILVYEDFSIGGNGERVQLKNIPVAEVESFKRELVSIINSL